FYRWEFATAVMGAVIGVNPFDQPDVEESKIVTRRLAAEYEKTGKLPDDLPLMQGPGMLVYVDDRNRKALGEHETVGGLLKTFLRQLHAGDYFALLAFIEMNEAHRASLQAIRMLVRDRARVATCVGFGPRFLHSTGQAYKGGPNTGVFLQVTTGHAHDVAIPGSKASFGVIEAAQARGDFDVLTERGRRALRVHIEGDFEKGLS